MKQIIAVNKPEETLNVSYDKFFGNHIEEEDSPIDKFYDVCSEIVKLTNPDLLQRSSAIPMLLILGFSSAVEEYLRSVFTQLIYICPYARSRANSHMIKFGSLDYYEQHNVAAALFDQTAFSSQEEIKKKMEKILGVSVGASLNKALQDLDKAFNLRHCAVHGGGVLNGYNADELGLDKTFVRRKLSPGPVELQQTLKICYSFVRAFNQHVFSETLHKWRGGKLSNLWESDKYDFERLIRLFWSTKDMGEDPEIRAIYSEIVKVPTAVDIYSYDDSNHDIINSIIQRCIKGDDPKRTAALLDILDSAELGAALDFLFKYDAGLCEAVLDELINTSLKGIVVLESIEFMSKNIGIRESHVANLLSLTQDADPAVRLGSTSLLVERYDRGISEIFPVLLGLTGDAIITVLDKLGISFDEGALARDIQQLLKNQLPDDVTFGDFDAQDRTVSVTGNDIVMKVVHDVSVHNVPGEVVSLQFETETVLCSDGTLQSRVLSPSIQNP